MDFSPKHDEMMQLEIYKNCVGRLGNTASAKIFHGVGEIVNGLEQFLIANYQTVSTNIWDTDTHKGLATAIAADEDNGGDSGDGG